MEDIVFPSLGTAPKGPEFHGTAQPWSGKSVVGKSVSLNHVILLLETRSARSVISLGAARTARAIHSVLFPKLAQFRSLSEIDFGERRINAL
jgi:hypothetical protein